MAFPSVWRSREAAGTANTQGVVVSSRTRLASSVALHLLLWEATVKEFNDDFYCRSVEEFENTIVPARVSSDRIGWGFRLVLLAIVVGGFLEITNWRLWLAILAVCYVLAALFA